MAFFSAIRSNKAALTGGASLVGAGIGLGLMTPKANARDNTRGMLETILTSVKNIEGDLMASKTSGSNLIDPVANFPKYTAKHHSLGARILLDRPDLYSKYCNLVTPSGFTLDKAIQVGIDATQLDLGVVAGDEDSYEVFKDFMDAVIEGWHGYKPTDQHKTDFNSDNIKLTEALAKKLDKYVVSTRVRAARSIRGLPLQPNANRAQRRKVESAIRKSLTHMTGQMAGKYYPLGEMTAEEEQELIDDHFLFDRPSPTSIQTKCGAARDWPDARGIFHNSEKNFLVWVNEEDHMRVIAMEQGANIKSVFTRWATGVGEIEKALKAEGFEYMYNDHLGSICTCPSNIGTGLRASVMIKLPKLHKAWGVKKIKKYCNSLGVDARGHYGERGPPGPNGEFDISNQARIGYTEVELVQKMIDGVEKLIKLEESV